MAQLNLALLVLDSDYHFFKIQQVFALQLLQLETNLFGLVGSSNPTTNKLLIICYPSLRSDVSVLTGSTFQSEERDQLLIHDLPVMIGALRTNFIPLDLNEARSRKRDPATGSRSTVA